MDWRANDRRRCSTRGPSGERVRFASGRAAAAKDEHAHPHQGLCRQALPRSAHRRQHRRLHRRRAHAHRRLLRPRGGGDGEGLAARDLRRPARRRPDHAHGPAGLGRPEQGLAGPHARQLPPDRHGARDGDLRGDLGPAAPRLPRQRGHDRGPDRRLRRARAAHARRDAGRRARLRLRHSRRQARRPARRRAHPRPARGVRQAHEPTSAPRPPSRPRPRSPRRPRRPPRLRLSWLPPRRLPPRPTAPPPRAWPSTSGASWPSAAGGNAPALAARCISARAACSI